MILFGHRSNLWVKTLRLLFTVVKAQSFANTSMFLYSLVSVSWSFAASISRSLTLYILRMFFTLDDLSGGFLRPQRRPLGLWLGTTVLRMCL